MAGPEEEGYAHTRLDITYEGDPAKAALWLSFAKKKVRDLLKQQTTTTGDTNRFKDYAVAPGIEIRVRVTGKDRFIHIKADPSCKDRRGFLLDRRSGSSYDALYNDGVVENVGSPAAVRIKGYTVPAQLQREQLARLTASKFSGLMRLVVGCYHAGGREAPFSYSAAITHGIVKKDAIVNNKAVQLYWLVEISSQGVFAAPVTNTGKCCDSWSVSQYMPKPVDPTATISLQSAFQTGKPGVRQLLTGPDISAAYNDGDPWFADSGWAFSASGAEAQTAVQLFVSTPAKHYVCARWKLTFTLANGDLSAALVAVERDRNATLQLNSTVWAPDGAATWGGYWGASSVDSPDPRITYASQDAPIFVYYDGEQEVVVRWSLTRTSAAAAATDPLSSIGDNIPHTFITVCPFGSTITFENNDFGSPYGGYDYAAYTLIVSGFSCSRFNHVGSSYNKTGREFTVLTETPPDEVAESVQFYSLDPNCYYVNEDGGLVTACASTVSVTRQFLDILIRKVTGSFGQTNVSSVVLFAEDREAVLAVRRAEVSSNVIVDGGKSFTRREIHQIWTKVDSGPCPLGSQDRIFGGSVLVGVPSDPDTTLISSSMSGAAVLCLDNLTATAPLVFTTGGAATNYNLETFLSWNATTKPTANSNVMAIHGNLHYEHPTLLPPDQRANRLYVLDNALVVNGGFANPVAAVGFVGKA